MQPYSWVEEENGKGMLMFLEEPTKQVNFLPTSGSLAVGVGKSIGAAIHSKPEELETPSGEAVDCFFIILKNQCSKV